MLSFSKGKLIVLAFVEIIFWFPIVFASIGRRASFFFFSRLEFRQKKMAQKWPKSQFCEGKNRFALFLCPLLFFEIKTGKGKRTNFRPFQLKDMIEKGQRPKSQKKSLSPKSCLRQKEGTNVEKMKKDKNVGRKN